MHAVSGLVIALTGQEVILNASALTEGHHMMVECPKCKFVQPKDRYCANCGLDIDSFTPTPKPLVKRLLNNPYFYIFGVAGVVAIMISFIHFSQDNSIQDVILNLPGPSKKTAKEQTKVAKRKIIKDTERKRPIDYSENEDMQPVEKSSTLPPETNGFVNKGAQANSNIDKKAVVTIQTLNIRFSEVPVEILDKIFSGATETVYDSENTKVQRLNKIVKPSSYSGIYSLGGSKTISVNSDSKEEINFMRRPTDDREGGNDDSQTGLLFRVQVDSLTDQGIKLRINASVAIRDSENNLLEDEFNNGLSLSHNETILIAGLIPHKKMLEKEALKFSSTPLSIMSSSPFVSNPHETEFVIFIWAE